MTIPLELGVAITARGLEVFNRVQAAIAGVGGAAPARAAAGLRAMDQAVQGLKGQVAYMDPLLDEMSATMLQLAANAGSITPAALMELASTINTVNMAMTTAILDTKGLTMEGMTNIAITRALTAEQRVLRETLAVLAGILQKLSGEMGAYSRTTQRAAISMRAAGKATRWMGREARASALSGLNVLSSATQGVMMAMGLLQGSVMSVGFGLIFLRYSIAPITLGVAGLLAAIGGTLKAISFMGPAFTKLVTGPMNKMKAAVVEAIGYFSGAVWVRIIAPSLRILADLAERFRDLALETWLGAEVQKNWAELLVMVQGLFQHLSSTIKEHGGILRWVVRTGFITVLNVLKGLVWLGTAFITVLVGLAGAWRSLSRILKPVWDGLRIIAGAIKMVNDLMFAQPAKEYADNIDRVAGSSTLLNRALTAVANILEKFPILKTALQGVADALAPVWENWRATAKPAFEAMSKAIDDLKKVIFGFEGTGPVLKNWSRIIALFLVPWGIAASFVLGKLLRSFTAVTTLITHSITTMIEYFTAWGRAVEGFIDVMQGLKDLRIGQVLAGVGKLMAAGEQIARTPLDLWEDFAKDFKDLAKAEFLGGWPEVVEYMKNVQGTWSELSGATMGTGMVPAPVGRRSGMGYTAASGGDVYVTVTGNNMYGKLDDETARVWAQQLGLHTMNRLSTRRGIGVR